MMGATCVVSALRFAHASKGCVVNPPRILCRVIVQVARGWGKESPRQFLCQNFRQHAPLRLALWLRFSSALRSSSARRGGPTSSCSGAGGLHLRAPGGPRRLELLLLDEEVLRGRQIDTWVRAQLGALKELATSVAVLGLLVCDGQDFKTHTKRSNEILHSSPTLFLLGINPI